VQVSAAAMSNPENAEHPEELDAVLGHLGDQAQPSDASAEHVASSGGWRRRTSPRLSERTVRRDWIKARAWLYQALYPEGDSTHSSQMSP
jgi:hypothetical protein